MDNRKNEGNTISGSIQIGEMEFMLGKSSGKSTMFAI